jgi:transcriptional regulator with XRE-family HTH domain
MRNGLQLVALRENGRVRRAKMAGARIQETLAKRLRALRDAKGYSAEELSKRAGVHQRTIQHLEYAQRWPRPAVVEDIANALGVDSAALFSAAKAEITVHEAMKVINKHLDALHVIENFPPDLLEFLKKAKSEDFKGFETAINVYWTYRKGDEAKKSGLAHSIGSENGKNGNGKKKSGRRSA